MDYFWLAGFAVEQIFLDVSSGSIVFCRMDFFLNEFSVERVDL